MRLYIKNIVVALVTLFCTMTISAQCSTTVSFDTWLTGSQSTNQNQDLNGTVTSIQFNLDFTSTGGEWPADMIVVINAPNGNCIGGEGYNINPPSNCFNIDFPAYWVTTASGFYTYTMTLPLNYLSGDGTWYFTLQNGWSNSGSNANYDLDIILFGICEQGGCTNAWACNYDPDATFEDNSICIYPEFGYDCDGNCNADADGDGICDLFEIPGCQDYAACNYSLVATDDDGSCQYAFLDEDCAGNSLLPTFNNAPNDINTSCANVSDAIVVYGTISSFASQFEEDNNPSGNCYAASWTVEINMTETIIEGDCPGNYEIIRHYTGIDCMNRSVEHTQTVTVLDNTPPDFTSGLESQTISCPLLPSFEDAIATDECSMPISYIMGNETTLAGECDGEYTLYRLITATDACGNSATAEQTIVVIDETAPVWDELIPEQIITNEIETGDFGMPTALDMCSDADVTVVSLIGPGVCPLAVELTRTFIATDACGNTSTEFVQVINETTDLFSYISSTTDASCSNTSDGSATVETSGGVHPYEESWGNLDPNELPPGEYDVTVTDDNLCSTVLTFTITSPPALQLTLESTQPECAIANSGTITAVSGGGTGELEYDWDGIDPNAVQAGDYTISVTDENGCSISENITVNAAIIPIEGDLDGNTEVMIGDSSVYEYEYTAGSTYYWTFLGADSLVVSDIFAISLLWSSGGEGFVCVQETNATGCVGNPVCLEINVSVGIDELANQDNILAYPNPTYGEFTCILPETNNDEQWRLIDLSGAVISIGQTPTALSHSFDFSHISSGSYILLIDNKAISIQIER